MHFSLKRDIGTVVIDLGTGIYASYGDSAEGKTLIYNTLRSAVALGDDSVMALTYDPYRSKDTLLYQLQHIPSTLSLLFLDRAHLYVDLDVARVIGDLGRRLSIFIDFKEWAGFSCIAPSWCTIDIREETIHLYEDNDL